MTIRPNFVAYEAFGLWHPDNTWEPSYFEAVYVEQPEWADPDNAEFWDEYAYKLQCNESFWYVQ